MWVWLGQAAVSFSHHRGWHDTPTEHVWIIETKIRKNIQWKPPLGGIMPKKHTYTFSKNVKWCTSIVHPYIYTWWNQTRFEKIRTKTTRFTLEDKNLLNLSCSENASRICYFHMNFTILSLVPNFCHNEHISINYECASFHIFWKCISMFLEGFHYSTEEVVSNGYFPLKLAWLILASSRS
jgi:hypothetical protein